MFANSGKVSLESVIRSAYDLKKPDRSWSRGIQLSLRIPYLEGMLGQLASGNEVREDNSSVIRTI
jgi:hypothetical protein